MTAADGRRPSLGIISPFCNEGDQAARFIARVTAALEGFDAEWSLVCVNDGSSDGTLGHLLAAREADPRIKVIDLSRNFGKEYALSAGLVSCLRNSLANFWDKQATRINNLCPAATGNLVRRISDSGH